MNDPLDKAFVTDDEFQRLIESGALTVPTPADDVNLTRSARVLLRERRALVRKREKVVGRLKEIDAEIVGIDNAVRTSRDA